MRTFWLIVGFPVRFALVALMYVLGSITMTLDAEDRDYLNDFLFGRPKRD